MKATGNKISLQLFPKGSATWTSVFKPYGLNPTGLYYVADMTHIYKESFLYFHNANVSSDAVTNLVKLFHNPPVAIIPTGWYTQTKATLDLGGAVPIDAPSNPTSKFGLLWYWKVRNWHFFFWNRHSNEKRCTECRLSYNVYIRRSQGIVSLKQLCSWRLARFGCQRNCLGRSCGLLCGQKLHHWRTESSASMVSIINIVFSIHTY